jgi:hypothetical protein
MSKTAEHFLGDQPYPDSPGFKEPTTSREAARVVSGTVAEGRESVFEAIRLAGSGGLTADEAAAAVGRTPAYVRPRVTELYKAKRIARTGERRRNSTGLRAWVWRTP